MNLSPDFNLESLNLDIQTYSKNELLQILKLPDNYNADNLSKNKNSLQDKINKLSISNTKKYSYLLFLDNAEKKLLNNFYNNDDNNNNNNNDNINDNLITNINLNKNMISRYDNNFIIENNSLIHNSLKNITVGQYNDNTRIRHISINSIFRPNYDNTHSSNFNITLPETINNVISMRISSIDIPINSVYNISKELKNNYFYIDETIVELPDGYYNFNDNKDISNSLIQELKKLGTSNGFDISVNPISNLVSINANSATNIKFIADSDISNILHVKLSLGWLLGFRKTIYESNSISGEAPLLNNLKNSSISRNFFLAINDFQNNAINNFTSAFSESLLPSNIIAKINLDNEYNSTMENNLDRTRYYDGPTQINKLSFIIYDEYGRIINLNNNDWSCVLSLEYYRAVKN